jgi:pimeloyl-ACP methyl ester carboxylesterase
VKNLALHYQTLGGGYPLVILHGLLGSSDNWHSIAKQLAVQYKVFLIDQRNHGKSPHTKDFTYEVLVEDLSHFFEQHSVAQAHIIGHSMGGKAAMLFAMNYPNRLGKLVVVDISPARYEDKHSHIFKALMNIDLTGISSREEAIWQLKQELKEEDEGTIAFLAKGLQRNESNTFCWRFNVEALAKSYQNIASEIQGQPFQGKTLFIKGQKSNYINAQNYALIEQYFPFSEIEEIAGAGHWVHAENPKRFIEVVLNFLKKD